MIQKIFEGINKYSSTLLVLTAIVGLYFVVQQLDEFNKQNQTLYRQSELLRKTLIQSYRPLGYIMQINPDVPDKKIIQGIEGERKDKYSFRYHQSLVNKGSGILVNIGHIYYISKEKIDFRSKFLNGDYDSSMIHFDGRHDYTRRHTLHLNDTNSVWIAFKDIEFAEEYNIYILLFYEDQDGNLYDTLNKLNLQYGPTSIVNNSVKAKIKNVYTNNVYHAYSENENKQLINAMRSLNHPMWKYFTIKE